VLGVEFRANSGLSRSAKKGKDGGLTMKMKRWVHARAGIRGGGGERNVRGDQGSRKGRKGFPLGGDYW